MKLINTTIPHPEEAPRAVSKGLRWSILRDAASPLLRMRVLFTEKFLGIEYV